MNDKTIEFLVNKDDELDRLDLFLKSKMNPISRSSIKKFIDQGLVNLNGIQEYSSSKKLKSKDKVQVQILTKSELKIIPSNLPIKIVYEDESLLVIDKEAGMVVHPGAGNKKDTLVNALIHKFENTLSTLSGNDRPGIVHRIDKETSGLIVVAKDNISHQKLSDQFSKHSILRKYLALVWGVLRPLNGKISTLIKRDDRNRQKMITNEIRGKKAITNYNTIKVFQSYDIPKISLIKFALETGRTHQIRVHMNYKKTNILGDKIYGKKKVKFKKINQEFEKLILSLNGQLLHACELGFIHPKSQKFLKFESKPPKVFQNIHDLLEKLSN